MWLSGSSCEGLGDSGIRGRLFSNCNRFRRGIDVGVGVNVGFGDAVMVNVWLGAVVGKMLSEGSELAGVETDS
jgi:hypothetical protein